MGVHMVWIWCGLQTPNSHVEQMEAWIRLKFRSTIEVDRVLDRRIGTRFRWSRSGTLYFSVFRMHWWMRIKEILIFEASFVHINEKSTGDQRELISTIILQHTRPVILCLPSSRLWNPAPPLAMKVTRKPGGGEDGGPVAEEAGVAFGHERDHHYVVSFFHGNSIHSDLVKFSKCSWVCDYEQWTALV